MDLHKNKCKYDNTCQHISNAWVKRLESVSHQNEVQMLSGPKNEGQYSLMKNKSITIITKIKQEFESFT